MSVGTPGIPRFALIIGAMKSGTTSLFEYLGAHPAVAPCRSKEPNFFSDERQWFEGESGYRRLWDWETGQHEVALEASTSYTMRPRVVGVPERIAALDAEFRFIYLMRDPVDRIQSHLTHLAARRGGAGKVGESDFMEAVDVSRYAFQLDAYAERWPRRLILPLLYEELRNVPTEVVERALAFLELSPLPAGLGDTKEVPAGQVHNTREQMAADQALSSMLTRFPWLEAIRTRVPEGARHRIRRLVGRLVSRPVVLTADQRRRAAALLGDDVDRLRDEWGVDTSRWRLGA